MGFDYPAGLMNYTMICPNPGMTATVTMYYFNVSPAGLFLRKYNAGKLSYTAVTGATMESVTIGGVPATKVTYEITDGGALDQDGVSNGLIIDPIGLGEVVIGAPKTGYGFVK